MTIKEVLNLKSGDQVYWTDPDEGLCSGIVNIGDISVELDTGIVYINEINGNTLECFADELS